MPGLEPRAREHRLVGQDDRPGPPVPHLDVLDGAVGQHRPAVVEQAAAHGVDQRLVAADPDGGRVEEAQRHREGPLTPRERGALQVERHRTKHRLAGLVGLEGELEQLVGRHRRQVVDRAPQHVAAEPEHLLELPDVGVRAKERELVQLDDLLQHPGLDPQDRLAVGSRVAGEARRRALGVVADQAVRPVAVSRAQHHGTGPDPVAVPGFEFEILDGRRVAGEVDRRMGAVERLRPGLVSRAEVPELGTGLDDRDIEPGLLQVGGSREPTEIPPPTTITSNVSTAASLPARATRRRAVLALAVAATRQWHWGGDRRPLCDENRRSGRVACRPPVSRCLDLNLRPAGSNSRSREVAKRGGQLGLVAPSLSCERSA